jgi:hypothetical protein
MPSALALLLVTEPPPDPARVAELLLQVFGVLVAFFAISLGIGWALTRAAKASDGTSDPSALRSLVTFAAAAPAGEPLEPGALVEAMRKGLESVGALLEPTMVDGPRVVLALEFERHAFVLALTRDADRLLLSVSDRRAANRPATESDGAPLDRRALRQLLLALNRIVRGHPAVSEVRWHKRERWLAGDRASGEHEPFPT